ncbi:DNAse I-like superfamily protein isoform X2 [Wolffia australiana]
MKRFFKPVEKEGNPKKFAASAEVDEVGRPKDSLIEGESQCQKLCPLKILTWNANSLLLRVKNDWPEFSKFVQQLDPDAICIQILMRALSNTVFKSYRVWWSLSESKYGGTALMLKRQYQPKRVTFSLDPTTSKHEPDGRVILAEFESFYLLNTYVPNNGWKDDETSFQRRRKWDKRMLEFVLWASHKPLIWCGDLNVSHQDIDVTHPDFFISAKLNGYVPPNTEDCGQPGFTLAERQRFAKILSQGKLVDAYRHLHGEQDMDGGFSWSGNPIGKYRGKRMRIDYFIVSEKLRDRITSCQIHGHGIELEGYYGSDHCPVSLELSPED